MPSHIWLKYRRMWRKTPINSNSILFPISELNECLPGKGACHHDAECINKEGLYRCQCKHGYDGDGQQCTRKCRLRKLCSHKTNYIQPNSSSRIVGLLSDFMVNRLTLCKVFFFACDSFQRKSKKEEIWLSPMTNAHTSTEKSKKHRDNIKYAT